VIPTQPPVGSRDVVAITSLLWLAGSLVLGCFAIGCSKSESRPNAVPVYPVDGQLLVGGKPASGAIVTFHLSGSLTILTATVRDDGRFVPAQADGAVGLPEGDYGVSVTWPEGGTDRLAGKYGDSSKPVAKLTVRPGVNLIPPIKLP